MDRDTIFISHATPHDNDFVRWLGDRLTARGYAVWADVFHLKGGTPFWTSIEEVLRKRAVKVIFVVSSHSIDADRSGVRNELSVADGLRKSLKDPEFIVPLRIDETPFEELPIQIHQLNTLDFSRDWDSRLPDLFDTLECARVPRTGGEPTVLGGTAPASAISAVPFNKLTGDPKQPSFADEVVDAPADGATPAGPGPPTVAVASPRPGLGLPDKPTVAVLPFANLKNDPDQAYFADGPSEPLSDPSPSIAVLPFANLSHNDEQQYFADGIAEDIITRLGRLKWLFVSARDSSFTYAGKQVDVKQVGRELGVRYVLGGSVRRSGQRLRIRAELSEASTGRQVWAEQYDVDLTEFFSLQDQIAGSVIAAIEPRLHAAEHQRFQGRPPESLDAWGLVMKAMSYVWDTESPQEREIAQALLKRAIDIDPDYPRANSLLAWTQASRVQLGSADARGVLETARAMAQRAIQRDPEDPWAHLGAGYVHMVSRDFDPAVAELSEAIDLNPSFAFAHVILGCAYGYGGMPDDGLHHCDIAARLSPRDFAQAANFSVRGLCHFIAGRFAEAVEWERRAVEIRPHFGTAWRTLAAAAGKAGKLELAVRALSEARRIHPSLSLEWVEKYHPIVHERDRAVYIDGLRAAGLE